MPLAYYDGQFVPLDEIKISPLDYGFARGISAFEYVRVYNGVPFRLDEHIQRFLASVDMLDIPLQTTVQDINGAITHIIQKNRFLNSGIKFYLTMGECSRRSGFGFKTLRDFSPHLMLIEEEVRPLHPDAPRGLDFHKNGISLKTVNLVRQLPEAKTINYGPGFVASRKLVGTDFDEILYMHADGYVTETPASNFFCIINDVLYTPEHNMLRGITRNVLLELGARIGLKTVSSDITMEHLRQANAAFITGTFIEMLSVRRIDDIVYPLTTDSPVYAKLRTALSKAISDNSKARAA